MSPFTSAKVNHETYATQAGDLQLLTAKCTYGSEGEMKNSKQILKVNYQFTSLLKKRKRKKNHKSYILSQIGPNPFQEINLT